MSKKTLTALLFLLSSLLTYVYYGYKIIKPNELKSFSLIDDGQQINNAYEFNKCIKTYECLPAKEILIETKFGRLRPAYWLIQWTNVNVFGLNAAIHHIFRFYGYGLLILAGWVFFTIRFRIDKLISYLLLSGFMVTPTFAENIIRLGPTEPYLLISILLASIIYWSHRRAKPVIFLGVISTFIKETGVINFLPFLLPKNKDGVLYKAILLVVFLVTIVVLLAFKNLKTVKSSSLIYSTNYSLKLQLVGPNMAAFFNALYNQNKNIGSLGIVSIIYFLVRVSDKGEKRVCFGWLFLMSLFNLVILVPWSFVLERYLLIPLFWSYLLISFTLTHLLRDLANAISKKFGLRERQNYAKLLLLFAIVNVSSAQFILNLGKVINYRFWYSTYIRYESEYLRELAIHLNQKNKHTVYVDADNVLDNWEVKYEIPIHMRMLYGLDIQLKDQVQESERGDLILSNSSLLTSNKIDYDSSFKLAEKFYMLKQIDLRKFVNTVREHPLSWESKVIYTEEPMWWWKIYEKS